MSSRIPRDGEVRILRSSEGRLNEDQPFQYISRLVFHTAVRERMKGRDGKTIDPSAFFPFPKIISYKAIPHVTVVRSPCLQSITCMFCNLMSNNR